MSLSECKTMGGNEHENVCTVYLSWKFFLNFCDSQLPPQTPRGFQGSTERIWASHNTQPREISRSTADICALLIARNIRTAETTPNSTVKRALDTQILHTTRDDRRLLCLHKNLHQRCCKRAHRMEIMILNTILIAKASFVPFWIRP